VSEAQVGTQASSITTRIVEAVVARCAH